MDRPNLSNGSLRPLTTEVHGGSRTTQAGSLATFISVLTMNPHSASKGPSTSSIRSSSTSNLSRAKHCASDGRRTVCHVRLSTLIFPILDSRLAEIYEDAASTAALDYPELGFRRMYWAAIRNDVVSNQNALHQLRQRLTAMDSTSRLAELSNIRILDILSWSR